MIARYLQVFFLFAGSPTPEEYGIQPVRPIWGRIHLLIVYQSATPATKRMIAPTSIESSSMCGEVDRIIADDRQLAMVVNPLNRGV